jgi:hypothetical protein
MAYTKGFNRNQSQIKFIKLLPKGNKLRAIIIKLLLVWKLFNRRINKSE